MATKPLNGTQFRDLPWQTYVTVWSRWPEGGTGYWVVERSNPLGYLRDNGWDKAVRFDSRGREVAIFPHGVNPNGNTRSRGPLFVGGSEAERKRSEAKGYTTMSRADYASAEKRYWDQKLDWRRSVGLPEVYAAEQGQLRRERDLTVPERHQLRIARDNYRNPAKARFLGGPSPSESRAIITRLTGKDPGPPCEDPRLPGYSRRAVSVGRRAATPEQRRQGMR